MLPERVHRQLPSGFTPGATDTMAVAAEMRDGETFSACAARLGMLPAPRRSGIALDDLDAVSGAFVSGVRFDFDFEQELEARQQEEDEELRRARIRRRRASERGAAEARGRGEAFSASYARKVDAYGNSTAVVCMKWLEGLCIYGDMCPELHTLDGAYLPPCSFFYKNGFCAKKTCPYKHLETERQHYHCDEHLRGLPCPRGLSCSDMHKRSSHGSMRHVSGPISREQRAATPEEMCMVSSQSMAFTPRDVHPRNSVNLNRLVHGTVVEAREQQRVRDEQRRLHAAMEDARARHARRDRCTDQGHRIQQRRGQHSGGARGRRRISDNSSRESVGSRSRRRDMHPADRRGAAVGHHQGTARRR